MASPKMVEQTETPCTILRSTKFYCIIIFGIFVRVILFNFPVLPDIENRVEISTPINSWKRVVEGVQLFNNGVVPYEGDIFHEPPLALYLYKILLDQAPILQPVPFMATDGLTAVFLGIACELFLCRLMKRESWKKKYDSKVLEKLLCNVPMQLMMVYLLCPYNILSCISKSTTVYQNFLLSAFVASAFAGKWLFSAVFLAVAIYKDFYPIMLLVPIGMYVTQMHQDSQPSFKEYLGNIAKISVATLTVLCILFYYSYSIIGSWSFLNSTYGFILTVPDLTPNIGVFWYFFTEVFEHFRVFFLWTFQINIFVYVLPLAIRLRNEPALLLTVLLMLTSIFKSYPSIGDVGFSLSFLPMWRHMYPNFRQHFFVGCMIFSCTVLAPVLWILWIYAGSANANFYFGITLAFNTAQIFLVTDLLFAFTKREYSLKNGVAVESNGKIIPMELQY